LGRIIYTGLINREIPESEKEIIKNNVIVESYLGNQSNTVAGYSCNYFTGEVSLLAANYYDNYSFIDIIPWGFNHVYETADGYGERYKNAKTLLTGRYIAVLGTNPSIAYIYSVMYYDYKGQMIQSISSNYVDGYDKEFLAYNFTGQIMARKTIHSSTGLADQIELYQNQYDHAGRLTKTTHKLNNGVEVILSDNEYDDIGRLKTTKANNKDALKLTYNYNVRSWITEIKRNNYAFEKLYYNQPFSHGGTARWNGNISTVVYDDYLGFNYTYDNMNRLTDAINFYASNNFSNIWFGGYDSHYSYDKNGNMASIWRIEDLALEDIGFMNYNGNQLTKMSTGYIFDEWENEYGDDGYYDAFTDYTHGSTSAQMTYNYNGSLTADPYKGANYTYNLLGSPKTVSVPAVNGTITYKYSATGEKLESVYKWHSGLSLDPLENTGTNYTGTNSSKTVQYVGNKVYENNLLKRILLPNGYIQNNIYYFYLRDHLGNNNMVCNASGGTVQHTYFNPYGKPIGNGESSGQSTQPYKFGGKEEETMMGVNLLDFEARSLDFSSGRFNSMDPLAEKYYSISPYAYCNNNPVNFVDPTGLAWRPTYTEDQVGNRAHNGYEWIDEAESYNDDGTLMAGFYAQAIFFSDNGTFDASSNYNIGSSTATVYLADGTTTTFDANTNPSSFDYATVPEGIYHATVGTHKGAYTALKMRDIDATSQTIELGTANPAYSDGRTYATGINIHKPGINNFTGIDSKGRAISQGCLLIDRDSWSDFIGTFDTDTQRANTVSVTVSRSMATPINAIRLPVFNFFMNGARSNFLNSSR
jgi:RHS repeat-associated protein